MLANRSIVVSTGARNTSLDSHTRDWVNALQENSPRTAEQLAVYVIAGIDL